MPRSRPGGVPCTVIGPAQACAQQLAAHAGQGVSAVVLAILPLAVVMVGAYGLLKGRRAAVYLVALVAALDGLRAAFYFGVVPAVGNASPALDRVGGSPEYGAWLV